MGAASNMSHTFNLRPTFLIKVINPGVRGKFLGSYVDFPPTEVHLNDGLSQWEEVHLESLSVYLKDCFRLGEEFLLLRGWFERWYEGG